GLQAGRRLADFRLGELTVLDDFPYLWSWMEEDRLLESRLGQPRLHTDKRGFFLYTYLWDLLIERLAHEYLTGSAESGPGAADRSFIIEFSRGSEHGGYQRALSRFASAILSRAAVMYVDVTFEDSLRKNRRRFNPARPGSILEHSLSDEKITRLYLEDDWPDLSRDDPQFLSLGGQRVPYVVFENGDDVTTGQPEALDRRLRERLSTLHALWRAGQTARARENPPR
ncbi:MAG: hypothetical protein NTY23_00540, partial [Chloroflexi bacterium]|nr:hypothetical protein [Chloroflexota bacterium]